MSDRRDVAIVVPVYNGVRHLSACLTSVERAIDHHDAEVIVVDDASIDESVHLVRSSFPSVRLIRLGQNRGEAFARNAGAAQATSRFVTFVDQDDVVSPRHLDVFLTAMDEGFDAVAPASIPFSHEPVDWVNYSSAVVGTSDHDAEQAVMAAMANAPMAAASLIPESTALNGGVSNTVFAERTLFLSTGGFPTLARGIGDYLLLVQLARFSRLGRAGQTTYGYRIHSGMSTHAYEMADSIARARVLLNNVRQGGAQGISWDVELLGTQLARTKAGGGFSQALDSLALARLLELPLSRVPGVFRRGLRGRFR